MKVIIFGASGMVGQGALRECLRDPRVSEVLSIGRRPLAQSHAKLRQLSCPTCVTCRRWSRSSPATTPVSSVWGFRPPA